MSSLTFIVLLVAIGVVWYTLTNYRETFVPEFLDTSGTRRTFNTSHSSYAQQTNHMQMQPYPQSPIPGNETPFRVNQYNSFVE